MTWLTRSCRSLLSQERPASRAMAALCQTSSPVPFEDHFSGHAAAYAVYRPAYPAGLPAFVAGLPAPPADHRLAWDCATGNGQAAHGIAEHFARVIATDA